MIRHSLGIRAADFHLPPKLPEDQGSTPSQFTEFLLLEKQGQDWLLSAHLPDDVDSPPALLEASELKRLQQELGDWGRVLSVKVNRKSAIEARVETPAGPRLVLSGPALSQDLADLDRSPLIFLEPTVWIFSDRLTGEAIRQAVALD